MEVVADLGERMLRRFALKVAELLHATPLHRRPRPGLPNGPPQPGVTVDNSQNWRPQAPRDEIVEAALPRLEGLAPAQLEGEELFAPVDKDPDDAQHRDADDLPATAHAQGEAIEVDVDHIEVGERACPPRLQAVLQRGDDARHCALREGRGLEQRLERAANPAGVAARQICGDHRFIDVRHSPLIARDDRRRPLLRAGASEEGGPRQRERNWASRSRERPLPDAVAVAPSDFIALVRTRPKRGFQLLVHGRLDRDADMLVDQFAERDWLKLMRSDRLADTLRHAAFLR